MYSKPVVPVTRSPWNRPHKERYGLLCQCPSWVNNGSPAWVLECPELEVERKSISGDWAVIRFMPPPGCER